MSINDTTTDVSHNTNTELIAESGVGSESDVGSIVEVVVGDRSEAGQNLLEPVAKAAPEPVVTTLGDYAYQIVAKHYRRVVHLEDKVLADQDSEDLHDIRVELRRLEMALRVFDRALALPKSIQRQRLQTLARTMGKLRDIDVQLAELRDHYAERVEKSDRPAIKLAIKALKKSRVHAFLQVKQVLFSTAYAHLKTGWDAWLERPAYKPIAALPVSMLLPDLLSPWLACLLLHPGWLIPLAEISEANSPVLHGLRKVCKRVRYQSEFFLEFYDREFHSWIVDIKGIQSSLGTLHDCQVLQAQLTAILPKSVMSSGLQQAIVHEQQTAMLEWDTLRQRYLQPDWRSHIRELILYPKP